MKQIVTDTNPKLGLKSQYTQKANLKQTRHGWVRLTPAYGVHLVSDLLASQPQVRTSDFAVLDPFCGTGTTALVCAQQGITAHTTDINPFLQWLATTKTRTYTHEQVQRFLCLGQQISDKLQTPSAGTQWVPPLHQIEKWWDEPTLKTLASLWHEIQTLTQLTQNQAETDLLKIAFCQTMIERANVSFGHQSMSFRSPKAQLSLATEDNNVLCQWQVNCTQIAKAALTPIQTPSNALLCDARELTAKLQTDRYNCVITSPPYPNRMSYIRELRPYMYWLGFLTTGREAGELDWQAIGGTWGCATSNLSRWEPQRAVNLGKATAPFQEILTQIGQHSPILSRYVHKYFCDMALHIQELTSLIRSKGTLHYVVGNSKFYDVLLPVEQLFAALFAVAGFENIQIKNLRKRTSKKELFEYVVSAQKP